MGPLARRSVAAGACVLASSAGACAPRPGGACGASTGGDESLPTKPNVDGARELDQQGVKAFGEGRYVDALALFRASRALGGPSSEAWNVARSLERLDDAEGAARAIDEYIAARDLSPQDRAEAEREGHALRARPSLLTVVTTPSGATVYVDGQVAGGRTPTTIELRAGAHAIAVRRAGYADATRTVEARFGRAVVVALDLDGARK